MTDHRPAAEAIKSALNGLPAKTALVLGSGLGPIADEISDPIILNYEDIPGFPASTVKGHVGRLVMGGLAGVPVICMQGRQHFYEGHPITEIAVPIRAFKAAGVERLILTNAAGSLHMNMPEGSLMAISDHINWSGMNPLIGPNDEDIGPRFFDMSTAYSEELRDILHEAARAEDVTLHEGVYAWYPGPNFETPAEIRAFRTLGADAVGMSTVPEVVAARHCGLEVMAISSITNLAAGMVKDGALNHAHTLIQSGALAGVLGRLIKRFLQTA